VAILETVSTQPWLRLDREKAVIMKPTIQSQIPTSAVHRALVMVDIENSTGRRDPIKARLRSTLYQLLETALQTSGISPRHRDAVVDRGDGALMLIHPADHIPKSLLFASFVPTIDTLVAEHNCAYPHLEIRLRVALHAGEINHDARGPFGEAIDLTCRLLDAPELKAVLKHGPAPTALAVSHHLYDTVIRQQYAGIDPVDYEPLIRLNLAGGERQGWVCTARPSSPFDARVDAAPARARVRVV
jgi:hypothetical protein